MLQPFLSWCEETNDVLGIAKYKKPFSQLIEMKYSDLPNTPRTYHKENQFTFFRNKLLGPNQYNFTSLSI